MLYLIVEPAEVPSEEPVASGKIYRCVYLMNDPGPVHYPRFFVLHREFGFLYTVRELENDGHNHTLYHRYEYIKSDNV